MPDGTKAWITRGRERWTKIARPQQIALIAGVAVSLVLVITFLLWSQQTAYSVLFSNLQTQDSSAIVTKLKAQKIPYQLADNGQTILVPAGTVDETRLMMAGNGLPSQGVVGFEIFDKASPLGMTDFTQQLDYQRALQGELVRTIQQINGVNQAWVNIVLPQSSLYTSSQQDSTASVTVRLNAGATLDPGQIKAVMHLVASAVQGLKMENVTLVDTNGDNLSDAVNNTLNGQGISAATYGSALDVEHSYEQSLSQQATSMLNTVLGPGKAVVRVNANLNWDQIQQDSTTYGQQPSQIANQTVDTTATNGQGANAAGGVPGTGSNLVPTPTATAGSGSSSTYNQNQSSTVYDVSQTVQHLAKAPGSVQRMTVAVFLDGQYPAAQVTAIQNAIGNAIGLNSTRGDLITVSTLPFNHTVENAAQSALRTQQQQSQQEMLWRGIALVLVALALVLFALRATQRRKGHLATAPSVMVLNDNATTGLGLAAVHRPGQEAISEGTRVDPVTGLIVTTPETNLFKLAQQRQLTEEEAEQHLFLKRELVTLAKDHPDMLAGVIMNWFDQ